MDGRELFLTNVSGVKADIRLAVLRRRCSVAFGAIKSIYSEAALDAREAKVQRIKISARSFFNGYSISMISLSLPPSLSRQRKYTSVRLARLFLFRSGRKSPEIPTRFARERGQVARFRNEALLISVARAIRRAGRSHRGDVEPGPPRRDAMRKLVSLLNE